MGKELGLRITETLQKRGMTQKELASRIGVTEAVVSRYVSGDRDPNRKFWLISLLHLTLLLITCLVLKTKNLIILEFVV